MTHFHSAMKRLQSGQTEETLQGLMYSIEVDHEYKVMTTTLFVAEWRCLEGLCQHIIGLCQHIIGLCQHIISIPGDLQSSIYIPIERRRLGRKQWGIWRHRGTDGLRQLITTKLIKMKQTAIKIEKVFAFIQITAFIETY